MSEPAPPACPFYVTGGTLKPGEPSYVKRRADTELYESILAGEFCYVLTARQMGKSSLMARTAKRLEQAGVASAIVDLTQIGSERGGQAAAQWYFGIANLIHRQLGIAAPLRPWWQERADLSSVQRLTDFFRELVLTNVPGRVVVFVDEIDSTIGLPFADDFFAALRACFNVRATDEAFERLTFVLLGVATPDQLIQDQARTPFNIGKRIDLTDFTLDESQVLAAGLYSDPEEAGRRLARVLHWTSGHPYLTQALCRAVRESEDTGTVKDIVDTQVKEIFLSSRAQREETNLKHARARLERPGPDGRRLPKLYRRVRREGKKRVPDQPTAPLFSQLKLTGVVKATEEGKLVVLVVRNLIYETVFTPKWAKDAMPMGRQLASGALAAVLVGVLVWYVAFQPRPYKEAFQAAIKDDGYYSALDAYTALRRNPFSQSKANELMQQFWEQRALLYALAGKRDESLLCYLKGLELKDDERLRRGARNLVGEDYEALQSTLRHASDVTAVTFSPDGQLFVTGSDDTTARIWDARTSQLLEPSLQHEGAILTVIFSPDGRLLVTGSEDKTARIWDAKARQPAAPLLQHEGIVDSVAFSPDGRLLATGSFDNTARIWDVRTGKPLVPPLRHRDFVIAVAFSPDGRRVATGSWDHTARFWDVRTGRPLAPPLLHEDFVYAVTFSPDGRTIVTGSGDGTARLWDAKTGKPIALPLRHEDFVYSVTFSPDGRTVATGAGDGTARLWDAHSGEALSPPLRHKGLVLAIAFSSDSQAVVTGSDDGTARLWDARSGKSLSPSMQHGDLVYSVVFSPDGRIVATGSGDGTARFWHMRSSGEPSAPLAQSEDVFGAIAFSPDGRTFATGSRDNTVRLRNTYTGKLLDFSGHQARVSAAAFSPDGGTLATGSLDKTVRLWDAHTGKPLAPPWQHGSPIDAIAFSPDGWTLATTGSKDRGVHLWDVHTGRRLGRLALYQESVSTLAFSPNGGILAIGAIDQSARLWSVRTGKPLTPSLQHQAPLRSIGFSPQGNSFFVATDHWLNTYSWDGQDAIPQSSQLLHEFWEKGYRFPSDCESCLQVVLVDTGSSFRLKTLRLDGPTDPPIEGDPKALLEKWQARLGLKFDEQMRPVPR